VWGAWIWATACWDGLTSQDFPPLPNLSVPSMHCSGTMLEVTRNGNYLLTIAWIAATLNKKTQTLTLAYMLYHRLYTVRLMAYLVLGNHSEITGIIIAWNYQSPELLSYWARIFHQRRYFQYFKIRICRHINSEKHVNSLFCNTSFNSCSNYHPHPASRLGSSPS
jgi:hypothetical protein